MRPRHPGGSDPYNTVSFFSLEPPEFSDTLRMAKAWGVTLNDLLIALMLKALARCVGPRDPRERRHELGVASIVNLRGDMGPEFRAAFGQFLAAFRVAHPVPMNITLAELARDIAIQTAQVKRERLYLQSLVAISASALMWPFLSDAQRRGYHGKNYPVWAGITMLDAGAIWERAGGPTRVVDYARAVSTGPLAPLVLAPTTAWGTLHAGITYRRTAFSPADIAAITADIRSHVNSFPK